MWILGSFFLLSLIGTVRGVDPACKDLDGKDVDWFVAIKIPNMPNPEYEAISPLIKRGQAFYYADSNNQDFRIAAMSINDSSSAIARTVQQAIDAFKAKDSMYMFYNDQPPNEHELRDRAHSKGLMNFNDKQGFWLVHSAPNFNDPTSGSYIYPMTSMKFGQSFLCATFLSDQLTEISRQVFVSHFGLFQKNLPPNMAKKYPRLSHIIEKDISINEDKCRYSRNSLLKTKGGTYMKSYEKNKLASSGNRFKTPQHQAYFSYLYANQVAVDKKKSLFVETWLNGPRDWKNLCTKDIFVKNIRAIKHSDGVEWSSELDHAKWAVTDQPSTVCIGDINRQNSQRTRGGGTLCLDDPKIWKFFRDSIKTVECCEGEKGNCEDMPSDSIDVPPRGRQPSDPRRPEPGQ